MKTALRHCLLAELLGTAVLLGVGAAVVDEQTQQLGHGGVAAAFGPVGGMLLAVALDKLLQLRPAALGNC